MKSIKMIGLAALAALMAMAFVGASSAMAESTDLCKEDALEGKCLSPWTHLHAATLTGEPGKLLTSNLGTVECTSVLFLGDSLGLGAPLLIHGKFTYEGCTRGGEPCTVTETSTDSLIEVLKEGHELTKTTGKGQVKVACGFFISCVYNGEKLVGHGLGPLLSELPTGDMSIINAPVTKVSGLCPEKGELDLRLHPLEKEAVYITA